MMNQGLFRVGLLGLRVALGFIYVYPRLVSDLIIWV